MKLMPPALSFLAVYLLLSACGDPDNALPDVDDIEVPVQITRWDQELFQLDSKQAVADFLEKHPLYANEVLGADQYPHDSMAVNYLFNFLQNPGSKVLENEIDQVYDDMSGMQQSFEKAFKYLKYYFPEGKIPKLYTTVSGFAGTDLFVSDSVIIVGLEYYLGPGATYRPLEFPNYILNRYQQEYIVPSAVLLLSGAYNATNYQDNSMLAEMIYYGKAHYFAKSLLPTVADSLLIGYTGEDLVNVKNNQDVIWAHFVDEKLLYEGSHFIKKKYMEERPKTLEIGNACPGRIGVWLGWEIVDRFMELEKLTLSDLMALSDAEQVFTRSRYKPEIP